MTRIIDRLPPEIARQLHPDRFSNESGYGATRERPSQPGSQ